ncbi:uncharacterized protein V1518DRAFT_408183 [Limtongia smithiae]|uniref:uncharacterized protein n=1 Tax=Limtongia smithiae TaxID=1125753 RepID=UPI0034CD81FD
MAPAEKRKRADSFKEIEIDVTQPEPLSKKELRKRKKSGVPPTDNTEPVPPPADEEPTKKKTRKHPKDETNSKQKTAFGIWIGNLSYQTKKPDLTRFFTTASKGGVTAEDIARIHMPKLAGGNNKGFAYVDFVSSKAMQVAIGLSETPFEGRKVLIKDVSTPAPKSSASSTAVAPENPPTGILFIGNLPFDTKSTDLEEHFTVDVKSRLITKEGEEDEDDNYENSILDTVKPTRVRMATFQDSGNCKGFAFLDYASADDASRVLKSVGKLTTLLGRKGVKVEFGQDRSFRWKDKVEAGESTERTPFKKTSSSAPREHKKFTSDIINTTSTSPAIIASEPVDPHPTHRKRDSKPSSKRMTPGLALASAKRASAAIVPSQGKKIVF